uniref:Uncharacterized protein n=1 Tax=Panagrolaimus sp. ES5 TaxID=591445 RepID=A0AC34FGX7_9BILA
TNPKMIELITYDKNEKLQYEGKCKIVIDPFSKIFLVEPENEEFKMISAMFKWRFVAQKNILFVFADYQFQDFAIIFDKEIRCKQVFQILQNYKVIHGSHELIVHRFLSPLFNEISKNYATTLKMKNIFQQWIEGHEDGMIKNEYIQLLKDKNIYELFFPSEIMYLDMANNDESEMATENTTKISENGCEKINDDLVVQNLNGDIRKFLRKRKATDISCQESVDESPVRKFDAKKFANDINIYKPDYELFEGKIDGKEKKYLYIFASTDKKMCYKFLYRKRERGTHFACSKCFYLKHSVTAVIGKDENQKEMVVLKTKNKHICEPIKFEFPKIVELKIVKSPNFQYINRKANCKIVQHLVIFDDNDRNLCYEYTRNKNSFICYPCSTKFKIHVRAKIKRNENGEELVELSVNEHKCDLQKFVSEEANILKEPDFKLEKYIWAGIEKTRILVFDKIDKSYYFVHTLKESNIYMCHPCRKLGNHASVRLCKNENGENFIEVKGEHLCSPRNKF